MPLLLRTVEPIHVSRGTIPERFHVQNDLEAVANGTLANIIRQLSSLSHHAEELFLDLINVGSDIATRASNLQARIDRLAVRVATIDSQHDESSMQDSLHTKPFSSSLNFNQQVVSRASLPPAMEKKFQLCDKPPPLDKLNVYRDDGKDGLKFYTDPSYFFDLWRQEMLKDTERAIDKNRKPHKLKGDGQSRHKKRVRQPHNTRERQRHLAIEQGELLMSPGTNQPYGSSPTENKEYGLVNDGKLTQVLSPNSAEFNDSGQSGYSRYGATVDNYQRYLSNELEYQGYGSPNYRNGKTYINGYRPSQPPPAPPAFETLNSNTGYQPGTPGHGSTRASNVSNPRITSRDIIRVTRNTLPPPPPLPNDENSGDPGNNSFPPPLDEENLEDGVTSMNMPINDDLPLPPPPDIPEDESFPNQIHVAPPPPPPPPYVQQQVNSEPSKSKMSAGLHKTAVRDGRSELLKAIRDGIELRKVETKNEVRVDEKPSSYHDVASILARRVAVEMSDSDSGSSEYDSDGWDETSA